jgi:hypothetical protein
MRYILAAMLSLVLGTAALAESPYPTGAQPATASTTGTTAAITATLPGRAGMLTYICGFSVRSNATAGVTGNIQVTGTISGTMNFTHATSVLTVASGATERDFNPCIPASAIATNIVIITPAAGSAGVISATVWGYRLPGMFPF